VKRPITNRINVAEILIYLVIIFIFSLVLLYFDWRIGFTALLLFVYLVYYSWKTTERRRAEWDRYLKNLSENIDWSTKNAVFSVPMPLVVVELDGSISWYNPRFSQLFPEEKLLAKNIKDYIPDLDLNMLTESKDDSYKEFKLGDRYYRVFWSTIPMYIKRDTSKVIVFLYLQDVTEEVLASAKYQEERLVAVLIQIDNYDEVMSHTEDSKRPVLLAEIEAILSRWAISLDASWKKFERDKFVAFMQAKSLKLVEERRFEILDRIREISVGNRIPVTLSMGIGADGSNPLELIQYAQSAMDLALGRGGDQAAVKHGTKLFFYGGKTKEVEKRTKVKSRVMANAIRKLMEQSRGVFIMGHEVPDLDSLGAALGIYRCARHLGQEAYIVLDDSNPSVAPLLGELFTKDDYRRAFITGEEALNRIDGQEVLVVVDTHRPSFVENPKLLTAVEKIIVIDHHRRSAEIIGNTTLMYLEPYASSASELVAEIIQYFDEKIKLQPLEAHALLAGITVDTKNFIFKTGVRTFEAASFLRRAGADPASMRQLFQDDLETFLVRAKIVKNAEIIEPGIALSYCPPQVKNGQLIAAQAADNLLTIRNIHTSFVLSLGEHGAIISGRSLGNINVQVVLEKLGGGGHLTIAGAQLDTMDLDEAKDKVITAIKDYLEEENDK
jgi:c-di-AMP phosphodiesterase-like protein